MTDDSQAIGQDDIDKLLGGSPAAEGAAADEAPPPDEQGAAPGLDEGGASSGPTTAPDTAVTERPADASAEISQTDVELLLNKAQQALESIDQPTESVLPSLKTFEFQDFAGTAANSESATLELMRDVQLDLTIELGRTYMHLEEVLQLKQGAVVALDKLAGDPADILVNGRLVARGEVLVLNDNLCVRVAELIVGDNGPD